MNDRISVIIPTYNRTEFLDETINSLLTQTRQPHEIILVDDGSEKQCAMKLEECARTHELIKYMKLDHNQGVSHARNVGVKKANGHFILFLDDDDLLHPEMLQSCLDTFLKHPDLDVVMSGGQILNEDLNYFPHLEKHVCLNSMSYSRLLKKKDQSALYFILFGTCVIHSFMFRKEVLVKYPFDTDLIIGEDTFQWMKLKKNGVTFRKIRLKGALYRQHKEQVSNSVKTEHKLNYLNKALGLLDEGFDKNVFKIMNVALMDISNLEEKTSTFHLINQYPLAFVYVKILMFRNRLERSLTRVRYNFRRRFEK